MSGSIVGILIKDFEVFGPQNGTGLPKRFKFWTDENKMYVLLGVFISVGFWAAKVEWVMCFVYATMLKAGLGTVMNIVFKKRLANIVVSALSTASGTANRENDRTIAALEAQIKALGGTVNITSPAPVEDTASRNTRPSPPRTTGG